MPVYEYKCTACEERFEVEQSFSDDSLTSLAGCEVNESGEHPLKKVFSAVSISFKGDGFYRNDARSGSSSGTDGAGSSSEAKPPTKVDASSNDSNSGSSNGSEKPKKDTTSTPKKEAAKPAKASSDSST